MAESQLLRHAGQEAGPSSGGRKYAVVIAMAEGGKKTRSLIMARDRAAQRCGAFKSLFVPCCSMNCLAAFLSRVLIGGACKSFFFYHVEARTACRLPQPTAQRRAA